DPSGRSTAPRPPRVAVRPHPATIPGWRRIALCTTGCRRSTRAPCTRSSRRRWRDPRPYCTRGRSWSSCISPEEFGQLVIKLAGTPGIAGAKRLGDAVLEVITEQDAGHRAQRLSGRGDLHEDVAAVAVLLDHFQDAADLALDPPDLPDGPDSGLGLARSGVRMPVRFAYLH